MALLAAIPGIIIPSAGAEVLGFKSSSSSNNSPTITSPSDVLEGNLMLIFDGAQTSPTGGTPTGFTEIADRSAGGFSTRFRSSYKIAEAGDDSTAFTGMNGSNEKKIMLVFSGVGVGATITPAREAGTFPDGNPANRTIASSGGTAPLITIGWAYAAGITDLVAQSPAFDDTILQAGTGHDLVVGYAVQLSSPSNYSFNMTDTGFDNGQGGYDVAIT